jgi:hypothetical protein
MNDALSPEELSNDLREGSSRFLKCRRGVVGLSLFSVGVMGGIALYQMGILKGIPQPRLPGFDTDKVTSSPEAYSHLATPDALLGLSAEPLEDSSLDSAVHGREGHDGCHARQ